MERGLWALAAICFAVSPALVAGTAPCDDDEGCSLNGVCTNGECVCDAAWNGETCSKLSLQPAPKNNGYRVFDKGGAVTSWGGTVIEVKGIWHMFVSEALNNCGLNSYATNLQLAHAVSLHGPVGPYKKVGVVTKAVADTPHIQRDPADGALLLFITGCGTAPERDCKPITGCLNGTTLAPKPPIPENCSLPIRCQDDNGMNVLRSASGSPYGPWELAVSPLLDTRHPQQFHKDGSGVYYANPAPLIWPNGTTTMLYRDYYPARGFPATNVVGLARAPNWRGNYTWPEGVDYEIVKNFTEDPHLYQDHRGNCHVIFHALDNWLDPPLARSTVGGHAYSKDCLHFKYSPEYSYSTTVEYTDGTSFVFARRERPEAILKDGQIIALATGVTECRDSDDKRPGARPCAHPPAQNSLLDYSWTLVQPVMTRHDKKFQAFV